MTKPHSPLFMAITESKDGVRHIKPEFLNRNIVAEGRRINIGPTFGKTARYYMEICKANSLKQEFAMGNLTPERVVTVLEERGLHLT